MNATVISTAVVILPSVLIQWVALNVHVYLVTKAMAERAQVCGNVSLNNYIFCNWNMRFVPLWRNK